MLPRMATLAQSRLVSLVRSIGARSRVDDVSTHAAALAYLKRVYFRPVDSPPALQPVLRLLTQW